MVEIYMKISWFRLFWSGYRIDDGPLQNKKKDTSRCAPKTCEKLMFIIFLFSYLFIGSYCIHCFFIM